MNRLILFVVSMLFLCSNSLIIAAPKSSSSSLGAIPQVHQVNLRLKTQWKLIQQGVKTGKITKDQAISLRADLKSVRQQEVTYFKQNGNHNLAEDQQTQLNQLLNKNSATLGETPVN